MGSQEDILSGLLQSVPGMMGAGSSMISGMMMSRQMRDILNMYAQQQGQANALSIQRYANIAGIPGSGQITYYPYAGSAGSGGGGGGGMGGGGVGGGGFGSRIGSRLSENRPRLWENIQANRPRLANFLGGGGGGGQGQAITLDEAALPNYMDYYGLVEGLGDQAKKDIRQDWGNFQSAGQQDLVSRGLAGTTMRTGVSQAATKGMSTNIARLNESLRREQMGAMLQGLQFRERQNIGMADPSILMNLATGR